MHFDDVYLVSEKLILTSNADLDELQRWLDAPLPRGYREYLTTLGEGTFCDFVQVLTPANIRQSRDQKCEFIRENYREFWGKSEPDWPLEEALVSVFFAVTVDGDEIYYQPAKERLFALPRHTDVVFWLKSDLLEPFDWTNPSGQEYISRPPFRYFEPTGQDRRIIELFTAGSFDLRVLAEQFRSRWLADEVRSIAGDSCTILFPKAIKGRVQLTQASDDPRVGIRIDYDKECSPEVELFTSDLRRMGFYETWRNPKSSR